MDDSSELSREVEWAARRLRQAGMAFVLASQGRVLVESRKPGLLPLLQAARQLRAMSPARPVLADRVVGAAALLVACWAGVRAVYAEVASEAAHREAEARRLPLRSERRVPNVLNRQGDGLCPFEAAVIRALEQGAGLEEIVHLVERLAAGDGASVPSRWAERGAVRARLAAGAGAGLGLAVLLPSVFHSFGLGPSFLPMHIPVLITGAVLGPGAGFAVGALAPLLSTILTGMPPLAPPVAQLMVPELATYGAAAGWLRARWVSRRLLEGTGGRAVRRLVGEYAWLSAALILGRLALALSAAAVGPALGLRVSPVAYVQAALLTGLPGLLVQLVVVPILTWQLADRLPILSERGEAYGTADAS